MNITKTEHHHKHKAILKMIHKIHNSPWFPIYGNISNAQNKKLKSRHPMDVEKLYKYRRLMEYTRIEWN